MGVQPPPKHCPALGSPDPLPITALLFLSTLHRERVQSVHLSQDVNQALRMLLNTEAAAADWVDDEQQVREGGRVSG